MDFKNILTQVLNKLGKKYEELSPPAKEKFDLWEKVLTEEPMTLEKLKEFIKEENERLVRQLIDRDLVSQSEKDIRLKSELAYGRFILSVLDLPKKAIENLETYLRKSYKIK